ncbi:p21-activated protein kinase-interacting protein 1-like [Geodia barretti]|uniref:P21-activated protein kinase-interacting protein 1-like n=2 Tax=Geodia barretti TaxID=519541 RepID=A0AA35SYX5_GEOBA|nr:p21-activated protein kinase-interacting protein 1-like [Geodia barretti]
MEGERDVTLAVGAYDASVACLSFNPEKGLQRRFRCSGHSGSVRAVAIHGQWLATGSTDETIRLYNLRDCSEIGSLVHHEGSITWLEFSGDQMYSASEDGNIAVWRTGTWECTKTLTGHKGPVKCLCVHPSGKLALSVGRDRILRSTWDLSTGIAVFRQKLKEVWRIVSTIGVGHSITSFIFIPNEMIAVSSDLSSIQLFSNASGECVAQLKGHSQRYDIEHYITMVKTLAVLPEKNFLFSASSDGSVRAWKLTQPLGDSVCMSVCETGSRLNCIALTSHSSEKQSTTEDKGHSCVSSQVSEERREVKQGGPPAVPIQRIATNQIVIQVGLVIAEFALLTFTNKVALSFTNTQSQTVCLQRVGKEEKKMKQTLFLQLQGLFADID